MKMMNKIILFSMALLVLLPVARGQNKELMTHYQSELNQLYGQVFTAPTDNERYHANESVLQLLSEALAEENSFKWQWDFGNRVSVLTASDNKFRIFTWPVVNDAGEYECFGFVQALNEKTKEYDITQLNDRSDDIVNRQEEVLGPDRWLGAVYQELIVTTYEGRTFYTLLGWNGVDCLTQRRIIEPICFKSGGSTPQFGQNVFRRESNLRRVVLEYRHDAMVSLRYEEQYLHLTERVQSRRSGRSSLASFFSSLFSNPSRSQTWQERAQPSGLHGGTHIVSSAAWRQPRPDLQGDRQERTHDYLRPGGSASAGYGRSVPVLCPLWSRDGVRLHRRQMGTVRHCPRPRYRQETKQRF